MYPWAYQGHPEGRGKLHGPSAVFSRKTSRIGFDVTEKTQWNVRELDLHNALPRTRFLVSNDIPEGDPEEHEDFVEVNALHRFPKYDRSRIRAALQGPGLSFPPSRLHSIVLKSSIPSVRNFWSALRILDQSLEVRTCKNLGTSNYHANQVSKDSFLLSNI